MLMFLLEEQTQKEVTRIFDHFTELLGIELFQKLFKVILTDNGWDHNNKSVCVLHHFCYIPDSAGPEIHARCL